MNNASVKVFQQPVVQDLSPNRGKRSDQLSTQSGGIDLRSVYPIAHRAIFARAWKWVLGFSGLIFFIFYGVWMTSSAPVTPNAFNGENPLMSSAMYDFIAHYCFYGALLILSIKLLYEELYNMTYYYGVEAEHVVITTGVFLKKRASIHTSLITDIMLERNLVEFLLGLYSIRIANPSPEASASNKICSLSKSNAIRLQDFLVTSVQESRSAPSESSSRKIIQLVDFEELQEPDRFEDEPPLVGRSIATPH